MVIFLLKTAAQLLMDWPVMSVKRCIECHPLLKEWTGQFALSCCISAKGKITVLVLNAVEKQESWNKQNSSKLLIWPKDVDKMQHRKIVGTPALEL